MTQNGALAQEDLVTINLAIISSVLVDLVDLVDTEDNSVEASQSVKVAQAFTPRSREPRTMSVSLSEPCTRLAMRSLFHRPHHQAPHSTPRALTLSRLPHP